MSRSIRQPARGYQRRHGAVLLGKAAEENELITIATSAFYGVLLKSFRRGYRLPKQRQQIVTEAVRQFLLQHSRCTRSRLTATAGLLWRKDLRAFADYCSRHWEYAKSEVYRHVQTGGLVARLEQSHSPIGENCGVVICHCAKPVKGAGGPAGRML